MLTSFASLWLLLFSTPWPYQNIWSEYTFYLGGISCIITILHSCKITEIKEKIDSPQCSIKMMLNILTSVHPSLWPPMILATVIVLCVLSTSWDLIKRNAQKEHEWMVCMDECTQANPQSTWIFLNLHNTGNRENNSNSLQSASTVTMTITECLRRET